MPSRGKLNSLLVRYQMKMISKKLKHQVPKISKHVWALVTLEGRGWKSPIQAVSNILPYGKQQSQNLQQHGGSRQGERWCGQTLMCDKRSQEAGQRQSQKHGAAQQHVQERTEGRAGKSLHYCLGFHLAWRGKWQRSKGRGEQSKNIYQYYKKYARKI